MYLHNISYKYPEGLVHKHTQNTQKISPAYLQCIKQHLEMKFQALLSPCFALLLSLRYKLTVIGPAICFYIFCMSFNILFLEPER